MTQGNIEWANALMNSDYANKDYRVTIKYKTDDGVETLTIPDVDEEGIWWSVMAYDILNGTGYDKILDEDSIIDVKSDNPREEVDI